MGLILKKTVDARNPYDHSEVTLEIKDAEMPVQELLEEIRVFLLASGVPIQGELIDEGDKQCLKPIC